MNKKQILLTISAFISGAFLASMLWPEKIVVKKETEIQEKIVIKEVEKKGSELSQAETHKSEHTITHREIFPDGRIVEDTIYESNSEQLTRLQKDFELRIAEKENEFKKRESSLKVHTNPKKLTVFGGILANKSSFFKVKPELIGGFSYRFLGPLSIGAIGTNTGTFGFTLGITF